MFLSYNQVKFPKAELSPKSKQGTIHKAWPQYAISFLNILSPTPDLCLIRDVLILLLIDWPGLSV